MKKQIAVGVDGLVEYAVDCYMKFGYEPAVLKVHRIFTVNDPAKHADKLFQFIFVARKRT